METRLSIDDLAKQIAELSYPQVRRHLEIEIRNTFPIVSFFWPPAGVDFRREARICGEIISSAWMQFLVLQCIESGGSITLGEDFLPLNPKPEFIKAFRECLYSLVLPESEVMRVIKNIGSHWDNLVYLPHDMVVKDRRLVVPVQKTSKIFNSLGM